MTATDPQPSNTLPPQLEVWSCDPRDIPPWTEQDKQRLHAVLAQVFGWPAAAAEPQASRPVADTPKPPAANKA